MKENAMTMNFEPRECVIFAQTAKIGTNENKAIHGNCFWCEINFMRHTKSEVIVWFLLHLSKGSKIKSFN